jgi:hypothetical protein
MSLFRRPGSRWRVRRTSAVRSDGRTALVNPNSREASLDKWLQRLSHLSQFGLFLFTIGTIYFTVIPLYQKAVLDEQIARREIELKQTTALLETAYGKLHTVAVRDFVFGAGIRCSGLAPPVGKDNRISDKLSDSALGVVFPKCFKDVLVVTYQRTELKADDQARFERAVLAIGDILAVRQASALSRYLAVDDIARKSPEALPSPVFKAYQLEAAKDIDKWDKALARLGLVKSPEKKREEEIERAVYYEKKRIDEEFGNEIRLALAGLKKFDWKSP